jgi:ribosomal subunit interface protein
MKIKHHFRSLQSSVSAKDYLEEKLKKLDMFNLRRTESVVHYLKDGNAFAIDIHVNNPEGHFQAKALGENYVDCADKVLQKLERQFRRAKDRKLTRRKSA